MKYNAIIRKDEGSDFGVEFPDIEGCISAGSDLDEAATMAREALELHLEGMLEDGDPIPEPRSLQHAYDAVAGQADVVAVVPVEIDEASLGGTQRLNISLSSLLVNRIDAAASERGMTRSGFLAEASRRLIGER